MNAKALNRSNVFSYFQRAAVSFADWAGWLNFVDRGVIERFKAAQSRASRNQESINYIKAIAEAELTRARADLLLAKAEEQRALTKQRTEILEALKEQGALVSNADRVLGLLETRESIHFSSGSEFEQADLAKKELADPLNSKGHSGGGIILTSGNLVEIAPSFRGSVPYTALETSEGLSVGDVFIVGREEGDFVDCTVVGRGNASQGFSPLIDSLVDPPFDEKLPLTQNGNVVRIYKGKKQ